MLVFKTKSGKQKPSLVTLDQDELISKVILTLDQVAPGVAFAVKTQVRDKSHTKASRQYGVTGYQYQHTFRSNVPVTINGDVCYPQIQIFDRTYSGKSLKVFVGFYRLICSNGLTVAVGEHMKWSIDHRMSSTEQMMQLTRSIAAAWTKVTEAQYQLELADTLTINPVKAIQSLDISDTAKAKLVEALPLARAEDNTQTVYGLYNFINERDRLTARRNSTAYLDRDTNMLATLIELSKSAA